LPEPVPALLGLENELTDIYNNYHKKLDEIRQLIQEYQDKQRAIRNEIKKNLRQNTVAAKLQFDNHSNGG
jgi:predicted phage-related endonuclease